MNTGTTTVSRTKVTLSPFLKHKPKQDGTHQLQGRVRVYQFGRLNLNFPMFFKDGDQPIFLRKEDLIKGQMNVGHIRATKYNSLFKSTKNEIERIIDTEFKTTVLDEKEIKEFVDDFFKRFNSDYLEMLKREIVDVEFIKGSIFDKQAGLFKGGEKSREPLKVDRPVLDKFYAGFLDEEKPIEKVQDLQQEFDDELLVEKIKGMSTEDIYKQGLWNKQNIFEMFGSIYYDKNINETYEKIVVSLFRYREHVKPVEDISGLNAVWLKDFFKFLHQAGKYSMSTKFFDPLKYNPEIFHAKKIDKRELSDDEFEALKKENEYKPKSLNKMIGIVKTLINGEKSSFFSKGYLKAKIDLAGLNLSAIEQNLQDVSGTRIKHSLKKNEIDQMFHFQFQKTKIKEYQQIFDSKNRSKGVLITVDNLDTARKLFLLQIFFGGLRGYSELSTAELMKDGKNYNVTFYQNKVGNTVLNPPNDYTEKILKSLKYKIPVLVRNNAQKLGAKVTNHNLQEEFYRSLLQTIGEILNLDRPVLVDNKNFKYQQIKTLLNPYFARKTFIQICLAKPVSMTIEQVALFTGHKMRGKSEIETSYADLDTIENKIDLIAPLKVGAKGK